MGNGGNKKFHLKKICHYFKDSVLPYVAAVGILTYAASNIFISVGKLCLEITVSVCVWLFSCEESKGLMAHYLRNSRPTILFLWKDHH